jgi:Kef-type K+ transport system membrane component KefB
MLTPTPLNRMAALRTGGLIGLVLGVLTAIPNLVLDVQSMVALSTPITAVSCILTLVGGVLMGLFGARAAGASTENRVRAGVFGGLGGGVVLAIISLIVGIILMNSGFLQQVQDLATQQQLASMPAEQRAAAQQAMNQMRGMTQTITTLSLLGTPIFTALFNLALGALGGVLHKPKD